MLPKSIVRLSVFTVPFSFICPDPLGATTICPLDKDTISLPFTSILPASCGLLITTFPEPFGVRAMFPFDVDTIAFPFTSKAPPSCGDVSTTKDVIAPATTGTKVDPL